MAEHLLLTHIALALSLDGPLRVQSSAVLEYQSHRPRPLPPTNSIIGGWWETRTNQENPDKQERNEEDKEKYPGARSLNAWFCRWVGGPLYTWAEKWTFPSVFYCVASSLGNNYFRLKENLIILVLWAGALNNHHALHHVAVMVVIWEGVNGESSSSMCISMVTVLMMETL